MKLAEPLSFDQVTAAFLRDHDVSDEFNRWALGALRIADQQLGHWHRVILSHEDILGVMLPHHKRCGPEIVPPSCSSVAEAIERLKHCSPDSPCRRKAEALARQPATLIFLSMRPIDHPDYADFQGLIQRKYEGLTHLDGLHRLMGWALDGRTDIEAYVAGCKK